MKPLIITSFLLALCNSLFSQTVICDEVWSGIVNLDSDVVVDSGCTLTIEAGTIVQGDEYTVTINGELHALGTDSEVITINVESITSRTAAEQFILSYVDVNEAAVTGAYSNSQDYLPGLTPIMDYCRDNELQWVTLLDTLQGEVLYNNESPQLGIYEEDFDDGEHQGWTTYNIWNCSEYPVNYPPLNAENGYLIANASANCSGCGGFMGTVAPELQMQNPGEFPTQVSFSYQLNTSGTFSNATLEYALDGDSGYSDEWNSLSTLSLTGSEYTDVDLELAIIAPIESIRFRVKRGYGCTNGNASNSSWLSIEDFKVFTNYAPTTEGIPFQDAVLRSVSSGGMTLENVQWQGDISAACDSCEYIISNSVFTPTSSYSAALLIQGEDNEVSLNDCSIANGFQSGIHLEGCEAGNINLLRTSVVHSSVQGIYCGEGWNGEMQNTSISNQNAPGLISSTNGTLVLNHCTIAGNEGLGINFTGTGLLDIRNSILWNNNLGELAQISSQDGLIQMAYSDVQGLSDYGTQGEGTFSDLEGNIEINPQFADNDSFELEAFSPCVDAGEPFHMDSYRPPGQGEPRSDMGWLGGPNLLPQGASGCMDSAACNYAPSAMSDDNSCILPEEFYNCDGVCLSDTDEDGICDQLESGEDQYAIWPFPGEISYSCFTGSQKYF